MNCKSKISIFFLISIWLINACAPAESVSTVTIEPSRSSADLSGVKAYLLEHAKALQATGLQIQQQSDQYYTIAKSGNFDYVSLWQDKRSEVKTILLESRRLFIQSNPQYEQMEGIVAGTPSLSQYDVILDAGTSGKDGGENVVPFDLTLPDGRLLPKPGHLFFVLEGALWGTDPDFVVPNLPADLNDNGAIDLGDSLPDANVLKAAADAFVSYVADLNKDAEAWQPTEAEAFGALVANVPTFSDFIDSWKNSRFVSGNQATEQEFVSTSRLSDLTDNVQSWQTIYSGLSPLVKTVDTDADSQIAKNLQDLHDYVADLYAQEQAGKRFTPEEAELLSAEGQNRATAIAGQVSQVAASLNIKIEE
jgi:Imelysin